MEQRCNDGAKSVRLDEAEYEVRVQSLLSSYARMGLLQGLKVEFMPLVHELIFNVLRDRSDRYNPLAETMRQHPERHTPLLHELLQTNRIGLRYVEPAPLPTRVGMNAATARPSAPSG